MKYVKFTKLYLKLQRQLAMEYPRSIKRQTFSVFCRLEKSYRILSNATGRKSIQRELSVYKQGKGSIQFPLDKPIPYRLVNNIVKLRAREILSSYA